MSLVLLPFPLAKSTELAEVMRPGGHLRPDSALRALRDNGLPAAAVSVVPRSEQGAKGRAVWYSSLVVDVTRLLRVRDLDAARAVHEAATELANHRSARALADALVGAGPEPDAAALDEETGGALTRLALLTASRREDLTARLHIDRFVGRVMAVESGTAQVRTDDDRWVAIPAPTSARIGLGAAVAVDIERLDSGGSLTWVRPAFASDNDPNQRVRGGPRLLTNDEKRRLGAPAPAVG